MDGVGGNGSYRQRTDIDMFLEMLPLTRTVRLCLVATGGLKVIIVSSSILFTYGVSGRNSFLQSESWICASRGPES